MEKGQCNTNHQAWKRRHKGTIKIQTNKLNKRWREGLGKILINRIMHHVYTNDLLNHKQLGFPPKNITTDAVMAVKQFAEEGLRQGLITILVSLAVKDAVDAAWWPGILKTLQDFNCPRNLYY